MLKGFNTHGTFTSTTTQIVNIESDVEFSNGINVENLYWDPLSPSNIKILEDGIYKCFFVLTTNTACQFAFAINGVAVDYTIQGTNKGAGQLTSRVILDLKKNDILSIKNHTSANPITLSINAGGQLPTMSALLTVFKITKSMTLPIIAPCVNEYHVKYYNQFKAFLLNDRCLQLEGSPVYFTYSSSNHQIVPINSSFDWEYTALNKEVWHSQGTEHLEIEHHGIYDIFADIITKEPAQLAIFINGVPDMTTISGRDSGGNRCIVRQFLKLSKGDIITVRNYQSLLGELNTSLNTGGTQVGHCAFFMGFLLSKL